MNLPYNFAGVIGSLLILFGFYRTSIGRWTGKSPLYELDNLIGATLVIIYQVHYHAYISVGVNLIWAVVAIIGVSSYVERRRALGRKKR